MPAPKRVAATVKLELEAGQASPGKVGQALGPHGINIMAFIAAYNAATAQRGLVVPAVVTVYADRSFDLRLRTPPTSVLLARAAGLAKGAAAPARMGRWPSWSASGCARSPEPSCPTSTPATWPPPSGSWPAPPAPWASRSSTPDDPTHPRPPLWRPGRSNPPVPAGWTDAV
jgi:ribosomal protein L11